MTAELVGGPLAEHLALKIPRAARSRHRRFPEVPAEDFEQAMWTRILANPPKFRRLLEEGKHGTIWLEILNAGTRLGYEDERFRRAQKAMAAGNTPGVPGYSVDDEEFYSTGMLGHLIPVLVEAEFEPAQAIERATSGTDAAGVRIQTSEPGNAAETYMAILIDVSAAWQKLGKGEQRLLRTYYGVDQSDTSQGRWERNGLASSMGITEASLRKQVTRALAKLQGFLGGASPWLRDDHRNTHGGE